MSKATTAIIDDDFTDDLELTELMDLDEFLTVHEGKSSDEKKKAQPQRNTSDLLSDLLQTVHKNLGIPRGNQPSAFRLPKEADEKSLVHCKPGVSLCEKELPPLTDHEYVAKNCKNECVSEDDESDCESFKKDEDNESVESIQQLKPKRRRQRTYKYNPKPVQQKSNRKFVPDSQKDIDYWEKRRRNNLAAKKSREDRRRKELEVICKMSGLEKQNADLSAQVKALQKKNELLEKKLEDALKKQK